MQARRLVHGHRGHREHRRPALGRGRHRRRSSPGERTARATRDRAAWRALPPLRLKGKREPVPAFELLGLRDAPGHPARAGRRGAVRGPRGRAGPDHRPVLRGRRAGRAARAGRHRRGGRRQDPAGRGAGPGRRGAARHQGAVGSQRSLRRGPRPGGGLRDGQDRLRHRGVRRREDGARASGPDGGAARAADRPSTGRVAGRAAVPAARARGGGRADAAGDREPGTPCRRRQGAGGRGRAVHLAGKGGAAGPRPRRPALGDPVDGGRVLQRGQRHHWAGPAALPWPDGHARRTRSAGVVAAAARKPSCCRCRRSSRALPSGCCAPTSARGTSTTASARRCWTGRRATRSSWPSCCGCCSTAVRCAASRTGGCCRASSPRTCCPRGCRPCWPPASTTCQGAAKGVLRDASVLGLRATVPGLEAVGRASGHGDPTVVREALDTLVSRRLLEPEEEDGSYVFTHTLVRDVAYAGLAKAERARRHAAVASWALEAPSAARGREPDVLIASQGERAARLAAEMALPADDPSWEARSPAVQALSRLARRASSRDDHEAADQLLRRALELMKPQYGGPLPEEVAAPGPDRPCQGAHRDAPAARGGGGALRQPRGRRGAGAWRPARRRAHWCSATCGQARRPRRGAAGLRVCAGRGVVRRCRPAGRRGDAAARAARLLRGSAQGRRGALRAGARAGRADRRRARCRLGSAAAGVERHHPWRLRPCRSRPGPGR